MVLPEIISDIQGAFADGPQILDIVLNYMTQPWIRDQIIDQSPEGLIKSNDGFQPLRHTHNHETHHNWIKLRKSLINWNKHYHYNEA